MQSSSLRAQKSYFDMMLKKSINVKIKLECTHNILTIWVSDLVDGVMDLFAGRGSGWFVHCPLAHPEKDFWYLWEIFVFIWVFLHCPLAHPEKDFWYLLAIFKVLCNKSRLPMLTPKKIFGIYWCFLRFCATSPLYQQKIVLSPLCAVL